MMKRNDSRDSWTFLTNHAAVLLSIAEQPDLRIREIADQVQITERSTQGIVSDLVDAGYLTRTREGRRNSYRIHPDAPLRHPVAAGSSVGAVIKALARVQRTD